MDKERQTKNSKWNRKNTITKQGNKSFLLQIKFKKSKFFSTESKELHKNLKQTEIIT